MVRSSEYATVWQRAIATFGSETGALFAVQRGVVHSLSDDQVHTFHLFEVERILSFSDIHRITNNAKCGLAIRWLVLPSLDLPNQLRDQGVLTVRSSTLLPCLIHTCFLMPNRIAASRRL